MTTDQLIANFDAILEKRLKEVESNDYRTLECMKIKNLWLELIIEFKKEQLAEIDDTFKRV